MRRFASLTLILLAVVPFAGLTTSASAAPLRSTSTAASGTATRAFQFAEGLGAGANVAWAEDEVPLRHAENLSILVREFRAGYGGVPLPVTVTGIVDSDADSLDDDGRVNIGLFGSEACLRLSSTTYTVTPAACRAHAATVKAPAGASARGVDAARRWLVANANAGTGRRVSAWDVASLRSALSEVRSGVRVSGIVDRNRNGIDDDGKVGFTSAKGSICLVLSRDVRRAGRIVYAAC